MKLGLALPQTGPSALDIAGLDDLLTRVEAAGVDTVWVTEQLFGTTPRLEPLSLLTYAAARTRRIRLGSAVLLAGVHNPVLMARSLATIDHLSGGRLDIGLGLGGDAAVQRAVGAPDRGRGAHLDAWVETLLALWSTQPVSSRWPGRWDLEGHTVAPGPLQQPHPPLLFGGRATAALARAIRVGDGWIGSGNSTPADFAATVARIGDLGGGHDDRPFTITKRQYLAVGETGPGHRDRLRAWYRSVYPGRDDTVVDDIVVSGSAATCVEALLDLGRSGADAIILSPVPGDDHQVQLLLDEVVPALRAAVHSSEGGR